MGNLIAIDPMSQLISRSSLERENGIYWKDQKDDVDGVTIPTPYLQQFFTFFRLTLDGY